MWRPRKFAVDARLVAKSQEEISPKEAIFDLTTPSCDPLIRRCANRRPSSRTTIASASVALPDSGSGPLSHAARDHADGGGTAQHRDRDGRASQSWVGGT
jgi:hypothetical protein